MNAGLDIHVRETVTPKLIHELAEGRLDTAIVALPVSEPSLTEVALFYRGFRAGPARPRMRASPCPTARCCARCGCCCWKRGIASAIRRCRSATWPRRLPRELLEGSSLSTLVQMVGAGIGVTLIPEMAVAVETRSAPVSVARFAGPQPSRTIGMVWRRTSPLSKQLEQIADRRARLFRNDAAADENFSFTGRGVTPEPILPECAKRCFRTKLPRATTGRCSKPGCSKW